jgi:hypothetical protein
MIFFVPVWMEQRVVSLLVTVIRMNLLKNYESIRNRQKF